jgi:integrase
MVRNSHVVLRKALADAERLGLVQRNAAATARPPSFVRPEFATWSSEDLREFFTAIRGERIYPALVVVATTGMRRGEVLGLRWSDLDLDAGQLSVVQTLTAAGVQIVPTFRTPHVTLCHEQLVELVARLLRCEHRVLGNPYDAADEGGGR